MNVTNLFTMRAEKCPHALAVMRDTEGLRAIGCPVCRYTLNPDETVRTVRAEKAQLEHGTSAEILKDLGDRSA